MTRAHCSAMTEEAFVEAAALAFSTAFAFVFRFGTWRSLKHLAAMPYKSDKRPINSQKPIWRNPYRGNPDLYESARRRALSPAFVPRCAPLRIFPIDAMSNKTFGRKTLFALLSGIIHYPIRARPQMGTFAMHHVDEMRKHAKHRKDARRKRLPSIGRRISYETFLDIRTISVFYPTRLLTLANANSIVFLATSKESAMINETAHTQASPARCGNNRCIPFMFNLTPLDARINCGHRLFGTVSHAYSYRYL